MKKSRILEDVGSATHISDESLELYVLNRLEGAECSRLEEHILMCEECRLRWKDTADYVAAIQAALAEYRNSRF